jgi:hypothetical protein
MWATGQDILLPVPERGNVGGKGQETNHVDVDRWSITVGAQRVQTRRHPKGAGAGSTDSAPEFFFRFLRRHGILTARRSRFC